MPYSDDEEHSPSEFYYPEDINDPNATFQGEDNVEQNNNKNSQDKIEEFIHNQKAKTTIKKTKSDMEIFQRYLETINKCEKQIEYLPKEELDHLLCKFFINVRKTNGDEYEPSSLSSFQRSLQRYLTENNIQTNILKDVEFEKSRQVLAAKRKNLVKQGKGCKPQATRALTDDEENTLFVTGRFCDSSPSALQRTMWWFLSMHFGFRARDESRKLCWGDVELQNDSEDNREMLVWLAERGTKSRTGQEQGHQRAFQPKLYATNSDRCPVEFYKKFRSHPPVEMNKPDSPFFLAVKHNCNANHQIWYKKTPLGKNEIGNFLSTAAKNANLQQCRGAKITNHSVRKTSISRLLDADIPENYVAQLSGHKSIDSLQSYKSAGQQHQRKMSLTLSRSQIQTQSNVNQSTSCNPRLSQSAQRMFSSSTETTNLSSSSLWSTTQKNSFISASNVSPALNITYPQATEVPLFAGSNVHTISGCNFHIYRGPVTVQQNHEETGKSNKRRPLVIDSDEDD